MTVKELKSAHKKSQQNNALIDVNNGEKMDTFNGLTLDTFTHL